ITSTLAADELLAFTSEFHIPEGLHPEVSAHDATIADFPEGKDNSLPTGRLPEAFLSMMGISPHHTPGDDMYPTFLQDDGPDVRFPATCDGKDPVRRTRVFYSWGNTSIGTIVKFHDYEDGKMARQLRQITSTLTADELLAFTSEFHIPDGLHPEVPAHDATIADFLEGKDNPLPTGHLPEAFLSIMGISPHHTSEDDMYPTFLQDDGPEMVPWTLANQDDLMHACTDRRLRLDAEMRIPNLVRARTIRMVLRVDSELAETPSVLNSELRNVALPRREVTGEENAGAGSSAFVPHLSQGEDEEEDLALDRKRKRSVVGKFVPPRKVVRRDLGESSSTHPTVGGKSMWRLYASSAVALERSISPPTLGGNQPLPETSLATSIMGSPTRVFTPEWNVPGDTLLTVPEVCADFLDNITPPGRGFYLEQLSFAGLLREMSVTTAQHATATAHLRSRFERQSKQIEVFQQSTYKLVADKDSEIAALKARLTESVSAQEVLEAKVKTETVRSQSLVQENASLSAQLQESQQRYNVRESELQRALGSLRECEQMISKEMSEIYETETAKVSTQDNRLRRMNMEFDFELYPHFLSVIAERRWLIGSGLRLAVNIVLESLSVREAFASAVRAAGAKEKSQCLIDGFNHYAANGELTALPGDDPEAIEKSVRLWDGSSFESDLESQLSVAKFVEGSSYESRHTAECEHSLLDVLDAHAERVTLKKSSKGGGPRFGAAREWHLGADRLDEITNKHSLKAPRASGLKINMSKNRFLGVHVDSDRVKEAALKLGCLTLKIPFLYLGSMVGGSMSQLHEWDDVVERVKTRLSKWKIKSLSVGGRLTLLKSVLGSMTIFHLSIFKVPMGFFALLNQFFVRLESKFNVQMDMEILYARGEVVLIVHEAKAFAHKGIDLRDFMHIKLGNWENTRFWEDSWIEGDLLRIPSLECSFRRKQRGGVEQEQFENLVTLIDDVSLSHMADRWSWTLENSGDFTVSSVRKRIDDKLIPKDVPHEEFDDYDDWRNWIVNLRLPSKSKLMLEGIDVMPRLA
nr:RNA-directed DNA polymerase, eukaryota [Tanacetum cinerariifolium]